MTQLQQWSIKKEPGNGPVGMINCSKAIYRGKLHQARRFWVAKPLLLLVEVDVLPLDWTHWCRVRLNADTIPRIQRHSCLPVYVRLLEIDWWCRDWIGITCSWLTCKPNIWVMVSSGENQWGLWGGSMTCLSSRFLILFFETIIWVYGKVTKQSIPEYHVYFVDYGWCSPYFCSRRSKFSPSTWPIGSNCDRIHIFSRDPSASLPTCICRDIYNWSVV